MIEEKKNIGKLFDSIAGTYDRFNHLLSFNIDRRWRRRAVAELDVNGEVLDVAAGTADLAIEIVRQDKARYVTGIDISVNMMALGRQKIEEAGYSDRIELMSASALDMPFPDGKFDAVTCAYGVRNFENLEKGLSEMYRVMRDGGRLVILEFSYPTCAPVRWAYNLFFTYLMPAVGRLMSDNAGAYRYFRNSVKSFVQGSEMAGKISSAGFRNVKFKTLTLGISTVYIADK